MNRDILIDFIPKPSNKDVILYDTSLKDLIDVDVIQEYNNLLPIFNLCFNQYLGYKNNIQNYEKTINNIYLYKSNWSEEDYLYNLQNYKKTYSTLFSSIKKTESKIDILQKKIKMINDKIEIQIAKENKEIENKKNNIDKKINENLDKLIHLKEIVSTLKIENEKIRTNINENKEDFLILQEIFTSINKGECKCKYCGSILSNVSENSRFYKKTYKNIENNKKELEILLEKKQKNDEQLELYNKNIKEINNELKNDLNFKGQDFNFYRKKSIEVLKLEGTRDQMINNIAQLKKELENDSQTKSEQFLDLKNKIKELELSLENLQKIKTMKENLSKDYDEYNKLKEDLSNMKIKMEQYKKFITIFFKIYEQKASEFCGKDFKFKVFDFDEYTLIEKFEIYYKNIEYNNLSHSSKKKVNDILEEKFYFHN